MKRSAAGRPSPYLRGDGRWAVQIERPPVAGKRRRQVIYGSTQAEVVALARRAERALEAGDPLTDARLTLGRYLNSWVHTTLPCSDLRPSTLDSYSDIVERHLIPSLGHHKLRELRPPHIRAMLTEKAAEVSARGRPLSARTVQYIHAVLRKALSDAVRDDLMAQNPALKVQPPRIARPPVKPLTSVEIQRVLASLHGDRLAAMWLVLISMGLRKGEVLGLRWDDLDLDVGTLTVARSIRRERGVLNVATGKRLSQLVEGSIKTGATGVRTLAIPGSVVPALRQHRSAQTRERLAAPAWAEPDRVFTTAHGTTIDPRSVNRLWVTVCTRAGVRQVRVHDLRHGTASVLLTQGVAMRAVMETLGHTRMATTSDIYSHVLDELNRDTASRMDAYLTGANSTP